jgi:hypothetical protein
MCYAVSEGPDPLGERERLADQADQLEDAGKLQETVAILETKLALERQLFGKSHLNVAGTLGRIAQLQLKLRAWDDAASKYEEAIAIRTEIQGAKHWKTMDVGERRTGRAWSAGKDR